MKADRDVMDAVREGIVVVIRNELRKDRPPDSAKALGAIAGLLAALIAYCEAGAATPAILQAVLEPARTALRSLLSLDTKP